MTFLDMQRSLQRLLQRILTRITDVLQDVTEVMHLDRQSSTKHCKLYGTFKKA